MKMGLECVAWLLLADTAEQLAKLRRGKPAKPIAKAA
jgi:hypothetical protein